MESSKKPFPLTDSMRVQRVEVYLYDLKQRLRQLRLKHESVIKDSVDLIEEIDGVSYSLLPSDERLGLDDTSNKSRPSIRKLINEFEGIRISSGSSTNMHRSQNNVEGQNNMKDILQNFERLSQSHVLKESLVHFKRAKESFDKVDSIIGKLSCTALRNLTHNISSNHVKAQKPVMGCPALRERIFMFDGIGRKEDNSNILPNTESSNFSLKKNNENEISKNNLKPSKNLIDELSKHFMEKSKVDDNDAEEEEKELEMESEIKTITNDLPVNSEDDLNIDENKENEENENEENENDLVEEDDEISMIEEDSFLLAECESKNSYEDNKTIELAESCYSSCHSSLDNYNQSYAFSPMQSTENGYESDFDDSEVNISETEKKTTNNKEKQK